MFGELTIQNDLPFAVYGIEVSDAPIGRYHAAERKAGLGLNFVNELGMHIIKEMIAEHKEVSEALMKFTNLDAVYKAISGGVSKRCYIWEPRGE